MNDRKWGWDFGSQDIEPKRVGDWIYVVIFIGIVLLAICIGAML